MLSLEFKLAWSENCSKNRKIRAKVDSRIYGRWRLRFTALSDCPAIMYPLPIYPLKTTPLKILITVHRICYRRNNFFLLKKLCYGRIKYVLYKINLKYTKVKNNNLVR